MTKFLFRPLDTWHINQKFGANSACIPIKGGSVITCDGENPPAGYKSLYGKKGHSGLDLQASTGTPLYAAQDGIVEEWVSEKDRGIGLGIVTKRKHYCKETGKDEYFKFRYWHQNVNLVNLGDEVTVGQVVAIADNTGYSSGSHLHFELKPVKVTFNKNGTIKKISNILQDNGIYGAVDPLPYMQDIKASEFTKWKTWKDRLTYVVLKYLK